MKRLQLAALSGLALSSSAFAQSNVTIYGSLDQSAVRISNIGGSAMSRLDPGTTQPDRFGFRGVEDLGDGLKAHFQLEGGFSTDTGASVSSAFWNRISVVGLSGSFGLVQLGHQPDLMFDWVGKTANGFQLSNFYAFHPGNYDVLAETFAYDNAIRYNTPTWGGLTLGAEAAAGEGGGRNTSFGANYLNGSLRVAAAYSQQNLRALRGFAPFAAAAGLPASGVMDKVKNAGIGATYGFDKFSLNSTYTQTTMQVGALEAKLKSLDLGASYRVVPLDAINLGFSQSRLNDARWNTVSLMNLYYLSKRTQIYVQGTLQRASSGQVAMLNGAGVSSTDRQSVLGVGLHHSF